MISKRCHIFVRRYIFPWMVGMVLLMVMGACGTLQVPQEIKAFNLRSDTPEYLERIAFTYYQRGDYERAISYYELLIENFIDRKEFYDTELAWATYEIGYCYRLLQRYRAAYENYEKVTVDYKDLGAVILARKQLLDLELNFPGQIKNNL